MSKTANDGKKIEPYGAPARDRPVPRISIQAFCETEETASVLQRAAMDRRLAKAHITVHMGGIASAAEQFAENPTPNLIVVECRDQGRPILQSLEALAAVCDANTKVIIIGADNDIALYRDLIRQGVNEYLVAPLSPLQVIEAVSGLYVASGASPIGRLLTIVGAKGGVGASTISHNVAWSVAEQLGISTVLVDLDLAFGTAGLDFNQDPAQGVADALAAPERLDDVLLERLLVKCSNRLSLFAAPATIDRDYEFTPDSVEAVLDIVRHTAPCIVVDAPHLWAPWTRALMTSSDEIVVVGMPDLASLRNTKSLFDLLRQGRPNDHAPRYVLNQVGVVKRPEIPVKDFAEALGAEPVLVLPFDAPLFGTAANNGQMLAEVKADGRAALGIMHLAQVLTGREVAAPKAKSSSLFDFLKLRKAG